ncbi:hypothetical protein BDN70DRAFT_334542 [Pholiota conissans]|uniref:Uncharacterized protein n=1 Tax=Pholiota conissans TaxID=109636 RepID=A0A9P5YTA7_9AGAR|nr:hypothetical protein BDN70DRAFT_334542 [Pholiota conissans]
MPWPTTSHFYPYQIPKSEAFCPNNFAYGRAPYYIYPGVPYWPAESRSKSYRSRRYSAAELSQHKKIYYAEPVRAARARRASRSHIYDVPRDPPPTPWMQTVPLPDVENATPPISPMRLRSRTPSIDYYGKSWSADSSFVQNVQNYAPSPRSKVSPKYAANPYPVPNHELSDLDSQFNLDAACNPSPLEGGAPDTGMPRSGSNSNRRRRVAFSRVDRNI